MITEGQRLKTVVEIFNQLFADRLNTRLIGGAPEPIYIPAGYSEGGVNNEKKSVIITGSIFVRIISPAHCMNLPTGASLVLPDDSSWILVTGTTRTDAVSSNRRCLSRRRPNLRPWSGCSRWPVAGNSGSVPTT